MLSFALMAKDGRHRGPAEVARAGKQEPAGKRRARLGRLGILAAVGAVGIPLVAHHWVRRRVRPPQAPRWGRSHRFAGRHGAIAFQELGQPLAEPPPLVLLHSFGPGFDASQWRAAAELLAPRHLIFAPDLPGWGRSESGPLSPEVYFEAITDFLRGVVREPAALLAAGLPAAYALRVAAERPQLVRALGLINPVGLSAADGTDPALLAEPASLARHLALRQLLQLPLVRATMLDLLTTRAALAHSLRSATYAAPERVDAALLEHHYRLSHQAWNRRALAAYLRGALWQDAAPAVARLAEARLPVWLVWGRSCRTPPVEDADLWLHRLPDARCDVLEGSAALPHAETPGLFVRDLERFLAGLATAR